MSVQKQNVAWFNFRTWLPGPWLETDIELKQDEWQRDPDEPESHVSEPRYAPARVLWTLTEPVVPGTYAIRVDGGPRRLVDVYADDRGRMMASSCCVPEFPVARCGFEFSNQPYMEPE